MAKRFKEIELIVQIDVRAYINWILYSYIGDETNNVLLLSIIAIDGKRIKNFIEAQLKPLCECILFPHVDIFRVKYPSVDPSAKKDATLSGLLLIPRGISTFGYPCLPLLGYQHGTSLEREMAPSCFDPHEPLKVFEAIIGIFFSSLNGFIVAMADYQGMGSDKSHIQPFVCAEPLSLAVADLLMAAKNHIQDQPEISWNGQTYLAGYSHGGYVTMAATRKLQEAPYKQLNLIASTPCAGPYSLSDSMRFLILRQEKYPAGYFLPMALRGFRSTYGNKYDKWFSKQKAVKKEYYEVWKKTDGNTPCKEINRLMPDIPRELLTHGLVSRVSDKTSEVYNVLYINDAYRFDPGPDIKIRLFHCPVDDLVSYSNSLIACHFLKSRNYDIELVPVFHIPLGMTEVHGGAAIPALLMAYSWLTTLRDQHTSLGPGEFLRKGQDLASTDNGFSLRFQLDGELHLYDLQTEKSLWHAGLAGLQDYSRNCICIMQSGGSLHGGKLAIFDMDGNRVWESDNSGGDGNRLIVTNTGKVAINDASGTTIWSRP